MEERKTRWGGEFGSGRLITDEVWAIIEDLPFSQNKLAMAMAWLNGCPRPQHNIAANPGGALANAYGDGRNNFLYGYLEDLAWRKAQGGNPAFYNDLTTGSESIPKDTQFEEDHVPASYHPGGKCHGFARSVPYAITSGIWRAVEAAEDKAKVFCKRLDRLEEAVGDSDAAAEVLNKLSNKALVSPQQSIPLIQKACEHVIR